MSSDERGHLSRELRGVADDARVAVEPAGSAADGNRGVALVLLCFPAGVAGIVPAGVGGSLGFRLDFPAGVLASTLRHGEMPGAR